MFVTLPQFHQPLLSAVALRGQQHWSAVAAHFPSQPWYLFVYEAKFLDSRMNHTMLVAWEEALLEIITSVPTKDHRAVYRVAVNASGSLDFKAALEVWAPTTTENEQGVHAVFRFDRLAEPVGPNLRAVAEDSSRVLVFSANEQSASQASAPGN